MLRWQRNMHNPYDYYAEHWSLKVQALAGALFLYSLVFGSFFIGSLVHKSVETITVHAGAAPVLFMGSGSSKPQKGAHQPTAVRPAVQQTTSSSVKTSADRPKKESPKKIAEKKKAKPEPAVNKNKKTPVAKNSEKMKERAVELPKKKDNKKAESQKKESPKKVEQPKKQEQKATEKIVGKKVEPATPPKSVVQETIIENIIVDQSDGLDINSYDPAMKAQMALGRAVARVWRPPAVTVKKAAHVLTEIDRAGKVVEAAFEQKSDVLAYDLSARAAVLRTTFPKEFWGKKITIVFPPR